LGGGGGGGGNASLGSLDNTFGGGGGGGGGGAGFSATIESIFASGGGGSFSFCEKELVESKIATTNAGMQKNTFLIKNFRIRCRQVRFPQSF